MVAVLNTAFKLKNKFFRFAKRKTVLYILKSKIKHQINPTSGANTVSSTWVAQMKLTAYRSLC